MENKAARPKDNASVAEDPECTFRPKINHYEGARVRQVDQPFAERIKTWDSEYKQKQRQLAAERARLEAQEAQQCTFHPQLNPTSVEVAARKADGDVAERLYQEAHLADAMRERARRHMAESEVRSYPYQPEINDVSRRVAERLHSADARPLPDRLRQQHEANRSKHHRLRRLKEAEADFTFKPCITRNSAVLAEHSRQRARENGGVLESKLRKQLRLEQEVAEVCTFAPRINEITTAIVEQSALFDGRIDFLTRQSMMLELKKSKQLAREQVREALECSFKPNVGPRADEVLKQSETRRSHINESVMERVERMAHKEPAAAQAMRRQLEREVYADVTFRPQISEISRALSAHRPSRATDTRVGPGKAAALEQSEEKFRKECTFKPFIRSISRRLAERADRVPISDYEQVVEEAQREQAARAERAEAAQREREVKEMEGCTFQPEILQSVGVKPKAVAIAGMARFLEFKRLAKRMEEEKAEREKKVFMLNISETAKTYTKPKPFKLANNNAHKQKTAQLAEEVRQQQVYPFKPQTLANTNRALLDQILADQSLDDQTQGGGSGDAHAALTGTDYGHEGDIIVEDDEDYYDDGGSAGEADYDASHFDQEGADAAVGQDGDDDGENAALLQGLGGGAVLAVEEGDLGAYDFDVSS